MREVKPKKVLPTGPRYLATGRRKEAIAKVWLFAGSGNIVVNDKPFSEYFYNRELLKYQILRPLAVAQLQDKYDVVAEAFGGGVPGQAGAVGLAIARALVQAHPNLRPILRKEGLLSRDPRMKERKKYGRKRARRSFQYTKR
ncbi:MAG: 30S ribosomal protein S9 [Candidatus Margulisiibacteriota bacterium]